MAKVEGSNPFIRFRKSPGIRGFCAFRGGVVVRGASVGTTCGYQTSVHRARARPVADAVVSHSSMVTGIRVARCVLRPRAGRNAWRFIYERIGDVFVIGAVGPEAQKDKAGFDAVVSAAKAARRDRSVTRAIAITSLIY